MTVLAKTVRNFNGKTCIFALYQYCIYETYSLCIRLYPDAVAFSIHRSLFIVLAGKRK